MRPIEIRAQLYFTETPNRIYPNGRWSTNFDVYIDGHELGGTLCSDETLSQAINGLVEDLRLTSDILPSVRFGPKRVNKWLTWMRNCLKQGKENGGMV